MILQPKAIGIDVSKWQGDIDWHYVAQHVDFAYLKATEGANYIDPKFYKNALAASEDAPNVLLGAYHFARVSQSMTDAASEANHFADKCLETAPMSLPPMLDIEWDKRASSVRGEDVIRWAKTFLATMDARLGMPICGIYTQHSFWLYRMLKTSYFKHRILWLASPVKDEQPTRPIPGWPPTIVQFTSKGRVAGIKGNVDMNYWWSGEEVPRTPSMLTALLQNVVAKFKIPKRSAV